MDEAHAYRYPDASTVEPRPDGLGCRLVGDRDGLFRGLARHPRATALGLRLLARTAATRFYLPPVQLEAGPKTFRFAFADRCGGVVAGWVELTGPGFDGNILPPSAFK